MSGESYPKEARNSVNRLRGRGAYDCETVHGIIASAPVLHVSFSPSEEDLFPTIIPMIGTLGSYTDPSLPLSSAGHDLYLHGHAASRLMKLPTQGDLPSQEGLPVCVAATHINGIVLSLTPFHNSMNYRSAVIHGYATVVTDEAERLFAMRLMTNAVVPHCWENSRVPPTKAELISTGILKVRIVSASAKVRTGGPSEDRKDEKDESVRGKVWTGVVPTSIVFGEPVAAVGNRVVEVPSYLKDWAEKMNIEGREVAAKAMVEKLKEK